MAAQIEHRTLEINGCFKRFTVLVKSRKTIDVTAFLPRIEDPSRSYEFKLKSRNNDSTTAAGQLAVESSEGDQRELVLHLSKTFRETYSPAWGLLLQFGIIRAGNFQAFHLSSLESKDSAGWKTTVIGKASDIVSWFDGISVHDSLYFKARLFHPEASIDVKALISQRRELDDLRRAMRRMRTTFEALQRPSIDITRLVFHPKRKGTVKNLYVPSHILTRFDYFQSLHSQKYSETAQTDDSLPPLNEATRQGGEGFIYEDSDDEWDIDDDPREPLNTDTFQATIHVMDTSALYFAPPQSAYRKFVLECKPGDVPIPPWHEWAEDNITSHTIVPEYKTPTSPKSLYRMADMLMIPELKDVCREQIFDCLNIENVVSEILSPLFQHYQELRISGYEFIQKNWDSVVQRGEMSRILTNLSSEEAVLVNETMLKVLTCGVPKG
ncbi:uncharacterized protein MELLADRAFT_108298 [Melampsora larici-populina 98AG31]|uniref:BTB domain-containing protein n=1 Tax=Melampsora larici-populina (strain 98AG31 / pathotype 3-4-7) TaxID=747676 RepID=F4RSM4_MELLP|nr:uncharacterized protein MELLADRAFT_108298 [Melampsora larici-populina 98AG31]EGG04666.1 hypothetical protein MELLADRAFT_108298 [Melampsora larici-populina 98AG31]